MSDEIDADRVGDLQPFQHPRFSRLYSRAGQESERRGGSAHRRRLLAGVAGRVVEVGAGHGLSFPHYPPAVTGVLAVEPDDAMRALAAPAAQRAPIPVEVVAGHADALPVPPGSIDVAVLSLVLCSVPDQATALAEVSRVLRPGGELRYYEHVRSLGPARARLQDALTPLWRRALGGCHPNRDTGEAIRAAGFEVVAEERFTFRHSRCGPPFGHLLGRAVRRA